MNAIYLITLITLVIQGCHQGSRVVASLFAIELGANPFLIGALISAYSLFPLVLGVYSGRVSDRFGSRFPMLAGTAVFGVALLLPFLWPRLPTLYVSGALLGIGLALGCGQPLTLNLAYNRSPAGRSGEVTGLRLTINNITHIGVPLAAGALGSAFGVTLVFCVNAAILATSGYLSRR